VIILFFLAINYFSVHVLLLSSEILSFIVDYLFYYPIKGAAEQKGILELQIVLIALDDSRERTFLPLSFRRDFLSWRKS